MSSPSELVHEELIRTVRAALRELADAEKAPIIQAYMKSEMPCLGIQVPHHRAACRKVFAVHPLASRAAWRATILALWQRAEYREDRHAAINLAGYKAYRAYRTMAALPMYRKMIVEGAWWDYVDTLAVGQFVDLWQGSPQAMAKQMRAWAGSRDLWQRRSAIVCQIKRKAETDLELLLDAIEPAMSEREFFLRKAIGWALREHAKTDPDVVIRYVRRHKDRLSPLSKREAVRNLVKVGLLESVP